MKAICIILTAIFPFIAFSKNHISKIHSIEESKDDQPHLILLENGSVVFMENNQSKDLRFFSKSLKENKTVEIRTDDKNNYISGKLSQKKYDIENHNAPDKNEQDKEFEPTLLNSLTEASVIFSRMRRNYQNESQCYNRAHIWTWEEFNRSGLKSKKYFLFFTKKYIRTYRYHWWFHVTPAVSIIGLGDRILDRRYTSEVKGIKEWTDKFIYSKRTCPIAYRYNDYRNNQETEHCYIIPVSMYYWQPRDIERRDRLGIEKMSYIKPEVNHAYWEAF